MIELCGNPLDAGSLAAQCLWLKQHEPYHFQRAARLMTPQDFIGYWLTGEAGIEAGTAATTDALRDACVHDVLAELARIAERRGLLYTLEETMRVAAAPSHPAWRGRRAPCPAPRAPWRSPFPRACATGAGAC